MSAITPIICMISFIGLVAAVERMSYLRYLRPRERGIRELWGLGASGLFAVLVTTSGDIVAEEFRLNWWLGYAIALAAGMGLMAAVTRHWKRRYRARRRQRSSMVQS